MSMVFRKRRSVASIKGLENEFFREVGGAGPLLAHYSLGDETTVDDSECDPLDDHVGIRDLATLTHLNEDAICRELKIRYMQDLIYTHVGDIVIAINPFRDLPTLYGEEAARRYLQTSSETTIPHVYGVAQSAYKLLLHTHKHQCCVISGESGAGKTETAKFLVEQLLAMCKGTGSLEQKIIEVNPLLEAFGNAKTVINDNSSRFGKFLEIKFGVYGEVLGATLSEYLLEKSRVVRQGDGERNFHVFYYMFFGLDKQQMTELELADITSYHYLRGGHKDITRESVIDLDTQQMAEQHRFLLTVMKQVGFTDEDVANMHKTLSLILHIGNIAFVEGDSGYASLDQSSCIKSVASLSGIDEELVEFMSVATNHITRGEVLQKNFTVVKAEDNRDATAKAIYGRLFAWIVKRANDLLRPSAAAMKNEALRETGMKDVSILDIFGFENFQDNSFEQFCINIANEQLQFYFNQHIFSKELQQYEAEGIEATLVSFTDNSQTLDMIFGKPMGLFSLLDEESRFPKATDHSLVAKYGKAAQQAKWQNFEVVKDASSSSLPRPSKDKSKARSKWPAGAERKPEAAAFFAIDHYAGRVVYNAATFLEKNRDTLSNVVLNNLRAADFAFVSDLFTTRLSARGSFEELEEANAKANSARSRQRANKASVSASFKMSLLDLMDKMMASQPHFIRCIKPNDDKKPKSFDGQRVLAQLRYTGVLETSRIRRFGYAHRILYSDFLDTYQTLAFEGTDLKDWSNPDITLDEKKSASNRIIRRCGLRNAQLGHTLVFLKYYHHDKLVRLMEKQNEMATVLTKYVRRFLAMRRLARLKRDKAQREAEEKARREREEAERLMQEKLRQEREAAERAAEAARRAQEEAAALERKREEQERVRLETMKRRKREKEEQHAREEAERKAREAAEAAEAARRQAEAAQQEMEAEQRRLEEEAAERARQEAERSAREAEEAEARRQERRVRMLEQAKQAELARLRRGSVVSIGSVVSAGEEPEEEINAAADEDMDPFELLLLDEDLTDEERAELKRKAAARRAAEEQRKRLLRQEYERKRLEEEHQRMVEMQRIAEEQERVQREEAERLAGQMAESQQRLQQLDFGAFSFGGGCAWGSPSPASTASSDKSAEQQAPAARPADSTATATAAEQETSSQVSGGSFRASEPGKNTASRSKSPTNLVSRMFGSSKKRRSRSASPSSLSPEEQRDGAKSPPASTSTTDSAVAAEPPKIKTPPPVKKKPSVSVRSRASRLRPLSQTSPLASEPSVTVSAGTSDIASASATKATVKADDDSSAKKTGSNDHTAEHFDAATAHLAPPPSNVPSNQPSERDVAQEQQAAPPAPAPRALGASSAAVQGQTGAGQPRRRKLVRGGNKKEAPVLKEWQEAMDALQDLDSYLDKIESVDQTLFDDSDQVMRRGSSAQASRRGSGQRRSVPGSQTDLRQLEGLLLETRASKPPQTEETSASSSLAASVSTSSSPPPASPSRLSVTSSPSSRRKSKRNSPKSAKKSLSSPKLRKSRAGSGLIGPDGKPITADDVINLSEEQRLELLANVKAGKLTVDDALQQVVETRQRQNCSIQ